MYVSIFSFCVKAMRLIKVLLHLHNDNKRIMNELKKNALTKPIWRGYADKGTENEVGSRTAGSNEFKAVFIMLEQCGLKWIKLLWFHFFSLFLVSAYDGVIFPGGILFFSVFVLASGGPSLGRTLPFTALVPGDGEGKKRPHLCRTQSFNIHMFSGLFHHHHTVKKIEINWSP